MDFYPFDRLGARIVRNLSKINWITSVEHCDIAQIGEVTTCIAVANLGKIQIAGRLQY